MKSLLWHQQVHPHLSIGWLYVLLASYSTSEIHAALVWHFGTWLSQHMHGHHRHYAIITSIGIVITIFQQPFKNCDAQRAPPRLGSNTQESKPWFLDAPRSKSSVERYRHKRQFKSLFFEPMLGASIPLLPQAAPVSKEGTHCSQDQASTGTRPGQRGVVVMQLKRPRYVSALPQYVTKFGVSCDVVRHRN